jgi:hypothetical protein
MRQHPTHDKRPRIVTFRQGDEMLVINLKAFLQIDESYRVTGFGSRQR